MSAITDAVDALSTKVESLNTVKDSAIALMKGLADQIRANQGSPAALAALADKIDKDAADLSDSITANTV